MDAIKEAKIWILEQVLPQMEQLKTDKNREKFCANFDHEYERRRREYKQLTGRDWVDKGGSEKCKLG